MAKYPQQFIRGVKVNEHIVNGEIPDSALFKEFRQCDRVDGCEELSINWFDNKEAIDIVLKQKKNDGAIQFKCGAFSFDRKQVDRQIKRIKFIREVFSYERKQIPDNKYHGNLLVKSEASKKTKSCIAIIIANCYNEFFPPIEENIIYQKQSNHICDLIVKLVNRIKFFIKHGV